MTDLYRGLLLVLTNKFYELILAFRTHIQSFKEETQDPENYFDVGVLGFWNLMLEIVLTLLSLSCLIVGVALIATLAIIFYPCHAFLRYASLVLKSTRHPEVTPVEPEKKIEPVIEESPVIIIKKEK